ncbi:MAG TPA: DUF763 domain-containing protein [Candidatus Bathyarchaeia archaeon]|nr:DUF763 domain-containing protein [Candidatus Bathyarchaeia archaeon]
MKEKIGMASLPLHYGHAPAWLVGRMKRLSKEIMIVMLDKYGPDEILGRLSDPFWFQSLGCVLGYDWHSSGVTTVVTGILKNVLKPEEHGLAVAGGKGAASLKTPSEIEQIGRVFSLSEEEVNELKYSSRMSAKVDNAAIQAGYPLYHHTFFMTVNGTWAVVQQGMNVCEKTARRYHWLSDRVKSFVKEPHNAIISDRVEQTVLNMTSPVSEDCQKTSLDLTRDGPRTIKRDFHSLRPQHQEVLTKWLQVKSDRDRKTFRAMHLPVDLNWKALEKVYDFQPRNYEELLAFRGIGPATVRGLALISELVYGSEPSWKDPVKFSWAYGGKDGVPFPVDRRSMDESVDFLRETIDSSKLGGNELSDALMRLKNIVPKT